MLLPTQAVSTVWGLLSPVPRTQTLQTTHKTTQDYTGQHMENNNTIAQYCNITTLQYYNITTLQHCINHNIYQYITIITRLQHYKLATEKTRIRRTAELTTFTNTSQSLQDCNTTSWQQRRQEYEGLQ